MKETILVVDDNIDLRNLLEMFLAPEYNIFKAHNGEEGLTIAEEQPVDLIILDMNMPRMSGMSMLLALREMGCKIPVIFMTAEGSEYIAVQAFRLGVYDYIRKPFSQDEIQTAVNLALSETRLIREKEKLSHALVSAQATRQTVATLAHHINNQLTITEGALQLLYEWLQQLPSEEQEQLLEIVKASQLSTRHIATVLRVLQKVATIELTPYHGDDQLIDIEEALQRELKHITQDQD